MQMTGEDPHDFCGCPHLWKTLTNLVKHTVSPVPLANVYMQWPSKCATFWHPWIQHLHMESSCLWSASSSAYIPWLGQVLPSPPRLLGASHGSICSHAYTQFHYDFNPSSFPPTKPSGHYHCTCAVITKMSMLPEVHQLQECYHDLYIWAWACYNEWVSECCPLPTGKVPAPLRTGEHPGRPPLPIHWLALIPSDAMVLGHPTGLALSWLCASTSCYSWSQLLSCSPVTSCSPLTLGSTVDASFKTTWDTYQDSVSKKIFFKKDGTQ